jgi:hypothetical protein
LRKSYLYIDYFVCIVPSGDNGVLEKIKLTLEWNRFDIAEEFFNEKIDWVVLILHFQKK